VRRVLVTIFLMALSACSGASRAPSYLFVWAGDAPHTASDFLGVIDASPASAGYSGIVASIATGVAGSHPHHTEHEMPANGHLLANGFHAGRTWLFDLSQPRQPRLLSVFGDVGGFAHPHTFRQTRQRQRAGNLSVSRRAAEYVGSGGSRGDAGGSFHWWPRGNGRTRAGHSKRQRERSGHSDRYIHTFNCGLYLLRGMDRPEPTVTFVRSFQGKNCGIPILTGHYWLQTVPEGHAIVVLDIANPEQPREVQTFQVGDDEQPHWLAIDPTGRRIVLNSSGSGTGNRLFVLNFDSATGQLSFDDRFRDAGSTRPGIVLTGKTWILGNGCTSRNSVLTVTAFSASTLTTAWKRHGAALDVRRLWMLICSVATAGRHC
jgi:hypothetical protein